MGRFRMSAYSMKSIGRCVSVMAICAMLACAPGGQGTPGKDDEQQRGRKKRDALLGPARASVLLLGTFELHDAVLLDDTSTDELKQIIEKLLEFKPTRIAVGGADQFDLDERYSSFLDNDYTPAANTTTFALILKR